MAKAAKLFDVMKNCNDLFDLPITEAFAYIGVMNIGKPTEYYIDSRTERNEENLFVVKPLTWNDAYFAYVCPYCQDIHIEAVNYIGELRNVYEEYSLKEGQLFCRCHHLKNLHLKFIIDMNYTHMWFTKFDYSLKKQIELHDKILSFVDKFNRKGCELKCIQSMM